MSLAVLEQNLGSPQITRFFIVNIIRIEIITTTNAIPVIHIEADIFDLVIANAVTTVYNNPIILKLNLAISPFTPTPGVKSSC